MEPGELRSDARKAALGCGLGSILFVALGMVLLVLAVYVVMWGVHGLFGPHGMK